MDTRPPVHQDACTQAQIDAFKPCIFSPATPACAAFTQGEGLKCAQCLETPDTAEVLGPLITHGSGASQEVMTNVAGCIAVATNDPNGTGCAGSVLAAQQCENAACDANCPGSDRASLQALDACYQDAEMGGCLTFRNAANCVDGLKDAAATCVDVSDFDSAYATSAPIFCLTAM